MSEIDDLKNEIESLKLTESNLRLVIQTIADKVGVGDEPRCKWICLEIAKLQDKAFIADQFISRKWTIHKHQDELPYVTIYGNHSICDIYGETVDDAVNKALQYERQIIRDNTST